MGFKIRMKRSGKVSIYYNCKDIFYGIEINILKESIFQKNQNQIFRPKFSKISAALSIFRSQERRIKSRKEFCLELICLIFLFLHFSKTLAYAWSQQFGSTLNDGLNCLISKSKRYSCPCGLHRRATYNIKSHYYCTCRYNGSLK